MASPRQLPRHRDVKAPWGIGIVGGGDISGQYCKTITRSGRFHLVGVSGRGTSTDTLINCGDVDIILNLTPPLVHAEISRQALLAGKHVYSEKPLAHDLEHANALIGLADERGLTLACAPATFLGPALQTARARLNQGAFGKLIGARGIMMYPGPDRWHANPAPLFGKAAGPLFDMGVYHISALIALFGPIASVVAMGSRAHETRQIAKGPRAGETIKVEVPTHISVLIRFACNAIADLTFSFDGICSAAAPLEIFGTLGSLSLPHPGLFEGTIEQALTYGVWETLDPEASPWNDDLWIAGLYAMTDHLEGYDTPWPTARGALHALEALVAIEKSTKSGAQEILMTSCERPEKLPPSTIIRWANHQKRAA